MLLLIIEYISLITILICGGFYYGACKVQQSRGKTRKQCEKVSSI